MRPLLVLLCLSFTATQAQKVRDRSFMVTYDSTFHETSSVSPTKRLIKAGLSLPLYRLSSVSTAWRSIGMDAVVEQKVNRYFSVLTGIETNYGFSRFGQLFMIELPIEARYYVAIGKKMRQQSPSSSPFRYYLSLQTQNAIFSNLTYKYDGHIEHYYRGRFVDHRTNVSVYNEWFNFMQFAHFRLGAQFKIGTTNYLDVSAAIPVSLLSYNKNEYSLATPSYVSIKYGLFWSK